MKKHKQAKDGTCFQDRANESKCRALPSYTGKAWIGFIESTWDVVLQDTQVRQWNGTTWLLIQKVRLQCYTKHVCSLYTVYVHAGIIPCRMKATSGHLTSNFVDIFNKEFNSRSPSWRWLTHLRSYCLFAVLTFYRSDEETGTSANFPQKGFIFRDQRLSLYISCSASICFTNKREQPRHWSLKTSKIGAFYKFLNVTYVEYDTLTALSLKC